MGIARRMNDMINRATLLGAVMALALAG